MMNIKRRKQIRRNKYMLYAGIMVLFTALLFGILCINSFAQDKSDTMYKYYKPIKVSQEETLISIANNYIGVGYDRVDELVEEICRINHITDADLIYEGQTIVIPYYSDKEI